MAVIIGSTRPGRKGEAVARWVYDVAKKRGDAEFELVDLQDFNLTDYAATEKVSDLPRKRASDGLITLGALDGGVELLRQEKKKTPARQMAAGALLLSGGGGNRTRRRRLLAGAFQSGRERFS